MTSSGTSFTLTSTAFLNGGKIPKKYTCDDAEQSPQLTWTGTPAQTQSLALIADDPDAPSGTWTHWLVWNIPATPPTLPAATPRIRILVSGAHQGRNDFHRIGYGGPCPPPGKSHRYFFKLYALDGRLDLKPGASRDDLETAIKPHLLAQTQWMGTYKRLAARPKPPDSNPPRTCQAPPLTPKIFISNKPNPFHPKNRQE